MIFKIRHSLRAPSLYFAKDGSGVILESVKFIGFPDDTRDGAIDARDTSFGAVRDLDTPSCRYIHVSSTCTLDFIRYPIIRI